MDHTRGGKVGSRNVPFLPIKHGFAKGILVRSLRTTGCPYCIDLGLCTTTCCKIGLDDVLVRLF